LFITEDYTHLLNPKTGKVLAHKYTNNRDKKYILFHELTLEVMKTMRVFKEDYYDLGYTIITANAPSMHLIHSRSRLQQCAKNIVAISHVNVFSYYEQVIELCEEYNSALEMNNEFEKMKNNSLGYMRDAIEKQDNWLSFYTEYLNFRKTEIAEEYKVLADPTSTYDQLVQHKQALADEFNYKIIDPLCISNPVYFSGDIFSPADLPKVDYYPFQFANNPALQLEILTSSDVNHINYLRVFYALFSLT